MPETVQIGRPQAPALIELRADAGAAMALGERLGMLLPGPRSGAAEAAGRVLLCTGPDRWLLRAPMAEERALAAELEDAVRGRHAMVTIMSDAHALFRLHGAGAREVLSQGVAIDLWDDAFPPGRAARCALARTSIVLHRQAGAGDTWDLYVESPLEGYLATWLATARSVARGERA